MAGHRSFHRVRGRAAILVLAIGLLGALTPAAGAASWEPSSTGFGNSSDVSAGTAPDGTALAVYKNNSIGGAWLASRVPGEDWGTPQAIPGASDSRNLLLGVDASGVLTLVWENGTAPEERIFEMRRTADGIWTEPRQIFHSASAEDIDLEDGSVRLAVSPTGGAVVAFQAQRSTQTCPWPAPEGSPGGINDEYVRSIVRESTAEGGDWGSSDVLSNLTCEIQRPHDIDVGIGGDGEVTVVWEHTKNTWYHPSSPRFCSEPGVQARTRSAAGTWQPVEQIGEPPRCLDDQFDSVVQRFGTADPDLVLDASGNRMIAFTESAEDYRPDPDFHTWQVDLSTAPAGGTFGTPEGLIAGADDSSGSFREPELAVNGRGDAAVIASDARDSSTPTNIHGVYRPSGGSWDASSVIATTSTSGAPDAKLAIDAAGTATAVWEEHQYLGDRTRYWAEGASRSREGGWEPLGEIGETVENTWGSYLDIVAGELPQANVFFSSPDGLRAIGTRLEGQAGIDGGTLVYTAGAGELNRATVYLSGGKVRISDSGSTGITPRAGCTSVSATVVACDMPARVELSLFGGADKAINATTMIPVTMDGGGGDDALTGGAPVDTLVGGDGDDTLDGNVGADSIIGGDGTDTVTYATRPAAVAVTLDGIANDGQIDIDPGTAGNQGERDRVLGDVENAIGGSGADRLTGDAGVNLLDGKGGNDLLDGRGGGDTLYGGTDTDTATYTTRTAPLSVVFDTKANDGEVDVDPVLGGNQGEGDLVRTDVENVFGGSGNDRLTGGSAANLLDGKGGDDVLDGRLGGDTLYGGLGTDTATYSTRRAAVRVALDARRNDGEIDIDPATAGDQSEGDLVRTDVENATGGSGDDILTAWQANAVVNVLAGGLGADHITTKDGTATRDRVLCGDGPDGAIDTAVTDASDSRSACEA